MMTEKDLIVEAYEYAKHHNRVSEDVIETYKHAWLNGVNNLANSSGEHLLSLVLRKFNSSEWINDLKLSDDKTLTKKEVKEVEIHDFIKEFIEEFKVKVGEYNNMEK